MNRVHSLSNVIGTEQLGLKEGESVTLDRYTGEDPLPSEMLHSASPCPRQPCSQLGLHPPRLSHPVGDAPGEEGREERRGEERRGEERRGEERRGEERRGEERRGEERRGEERSGMRERGKEFNSVV